MTSLWIRLGLLSCLLRLASPAEAGGMTSPLSWSPDAQWLSYTVATGWEPPGHAPGWLFDTARQPQAGLERGGPGQPKRPSGSADYQLWVTHREALSSVLIEESAWPLTAPAWSPVGRSLVFGRFVPESIAPLQPIPTGRLEVVVQDGLDRKRVLLTLPGFELDPQTQAGFPRLAAAWSPDGQYLAIPRPGRQPAILIVRADSRKLLQVLQPARLPAWSPDGTKLAFLRDEGSALSLQLVEHRGQTLLTPRPIASLGRLTAAPSWSLDGRSVFAVMEKSGPRSQELDLARIFLESGDVLRVLTLAPETMRRGAAIRGVTIAFDRDEERCFVAVDLEGRDTDIALSVPRDRVMQKRFHPLDPSLRIASLAVAPDGRAVAARFGLPGGLTLPVVYDLMTDRTALIIPDPAARRAWLNVLLLTARALLLDALPPAVAAGRVGERPTLLPLLGEIPARDLHHARLARLGRLGSGLCDRPRPGEALSDPEDRRAVAEARLFFDYLRGDFVAAAAALEELDPQVGASDQRLALLSLRAQILSSLRETVRARAIVDYLLATEGRPIRRIEETPIGPVLTSDPDPRQAWLLYLSARISEAPPPGPLPGHDLPDGRINLELPDPFAPPEPPVIEPDQGGGVRAVPFAPMPPGLIRDGVTGPERFPQLSPARRPGPGGR